MRTLKWFKARIGKRIYRDANKCKCETCYVITLNGLTVNDEDHAEYLYNLQNDFYADDKFDLNYRDKLLVKEK